MPTSYQRARARRNGCAQPQSIEQLQIMGRHQNQPSRAQYVKKREKKKNTARSSSRRTTPHSSDTWQAATSLPGEIYTPAGRIRSSGAFLAGLLSRDPRRRALRNEGLRPLLFMLPLTVACCVVVSLLVKLLQALL